MNECKICGSNLFKSITFTNMFKLNYYVHDECLKKLEYNSENIVIPIEENIIIYDYIFTGIPGGFNYEYLWFNYFFKVIDKYVESDEWSMMIIHDELIDDFFLNYNPYLVINLTNKPILLVSLKEENLYYLEGL